MSGPVRHEQPKRSKGELYDAIVELAVPPIPNKPTAKNPSPTGVAVAPSAVRMVLVVMARHTNPNRDQRNGPSGEWRCCPSVETIAFQADVSERQVQRVLEVFVGFGYVEIERQGMRAGRNRAATPTWWRLRPDLWPRRDLGRNGSDVHVVTNGDSGMVATHAPMVASPAARPSNGHDAGDGEVSMVATYTSPEPGTPGTRVNEVQHVSLNTRAGASTSSAPRDFSNGDTADFVGNERTRGHQLGLPRAAAVEIAPPRPRYACPGCGDVHKRMGPGSTAFLVDLDGKGHWGYCKVARAGRRKPSQWPDPPPGVEPEAPDAASEPIAPSQQVAV